MAKIVTISESGIKAIVKSVAATKIIVSGTLQGKVGDQGKQGNGVPLGGNPDEVLAKLTSADNATYWREPTSFRISRTVTQTAHGFSAGQILFFNGTSYQLSQANIVANAEVIGMVSSVIDANSFRLGVEGYMTGLSGLTPGPLYWLSPTLAGGMTTVMPTTSGQVAKPVFVAISATSGFFRNYIGREV